VSYKSHKALQLRMIFACFCWCYHWFKWNDL